MKKNVFYGENKSERQMGEISVPHGEGPFPGVILVHGGGWKSRGLEDMRSIARSLVQHGFVVFNINYRFAPENKHPAPVLDLKSALAFLKSKSSEYKLDPKRLGLWGYSSGGHTVSYFAVTQKEPSLKAVVAGGAPYDFTWYPHSPYIKDYLGDYRDNMPEKYREASVPNKVTSETPPFFLYHAKEDRLVEYAQMSAFEAKLKEHQVPVKTYEVAFWGHALAFALPSGPVKEGIKFLETYLRQR